LNSIKAQGNKKKAKNHIRDWEIRYSRPGSAKETRKVGDLWGAKGGDPQVPGGGSK